MFRWRHEGSSISIRLFALCLGLSCLESSVRSYISLVEAWGWIDLEVLLVYGGAHFILFFVAALFTFWTVRGWGSLAPAGLSAFIFVAVILFFYFSFGDVGGLAVSILGFSSVVQDCCLVFLYRNTGLSK